MTFYIDNKPNTYNLLKPIFVDSYSEHLKDAVEEEFNEVCSHSLCASVVADGNKIKSFSFHREMSCFDPAKPPDYLKDSPESYKQYLKILGPVLTIEWLTVAPEYLGAFTKVQPVDVHLGLAMHFMQITNYAGIMGFSRQDTKVDKVTMRLGTKCHGVVDRFGIPCGVMLVENGQVLPHPIKPTEAKIQELFANRKNHLAHLETSKRGIAA